MDPLELTKYIYYDNGNLFWCKRTPEMFKGDQKESSCASWNTRHSNKQCTYYLTPDKSYYRVILCRKKILVHRAVWALIIGEWPEDVIDHIDGNPFNNHFENLRSVKQIDNTRNRALSKNNTSGYSGVNWDSHNNIWIGRVYVNHRQIRVYSGSDKEKAIEKVLEARGKFGFHKNHGRGEQHSKEKDE